MAQFRVTIDDSENIATQEQGDEFFSDANESANTISILPPVYSRTNWVIDLAFQVERDPPNPETGEETDFKDYTITEMFVNTVAFYANGEPIPTNVDETDYFNINVFSNTGTQEIIIPGTPEIPGTPATPEQLAVGEAIYTTPGTYSWICPQGVTTVCAVAVGGGGSGRNVAGITGGVAAGGGGGGLGWRNNITVVPGQSYQVIVGAGGAAVAQNQNGLPGTASYFTNAVTGGGGAGGVLGAGSAAGGTYVGDGGGNGGNGANTGAIERWQGGGGAGGYAGNGGNGGTENANGTTTPPTAGSGGGGGGGLSYAGGGVGLFGQGLNGAAGASGNYEGRGGSGGGNGSNSTGGGLYGGGGAGNSLVGGKGAVRIIWGEGRSFPSTRTAEEPQSEYIAATSGTDPIPATPDTIEYITITSGESIGKVSLQEYESPFNDNWQYLGEDKQQVTVNEAEELPAPKTYLGVFSWNNPNPDYFLIVRDFEILAEDNLGGTYTFNASLRQGYYFSYTPYITAIPKEVNEGRW